MSCMSNLYPIEVETRDFAMLPPLPLALRGVSQKPVDFPCVQLSKVLVAMHFGRKEKITDTFLLSVFHFVGLLGRSLRVVVHVRSNSKSEKSVTTK